MDVTETFLKLNAAPSTDVLIKELSSKTVKDIKFIEDERWEIHTTDGVKYELEAIAAQFERDGDCIPSLTLSREATPKEIEEFRIDAYKGRHKTMFEAMKRCRGQASLKTMTECIQKEVENVYKKRLRKSEGK